MVATAVTDGIPVADIEAMITMAAMIAAVDAVITIIRIWS